MELTREVLHSRYATFSDEALVAAQAVGPKPYSPLAWEVIQALVAARGLGGRAPAGGALKPEPAAPPAPPPRPAAPVARSAPTPRAFPAAQAAPAPRAPRVSASAPTPKAFPAVEVSSILSTAPTPKAFPAARGRTSSATPTPRSVPAMPAAALSPYLLMNRIRHERWPTDAPLPTLARDIMGWAALIYGVFGLALVIAAFVLRGLAALRAPGVIELTAVSAVSLAFGYSVRRPPAPPFWWLAMIYCGASPTLALTRIGGFTAPRWPQVVAGAVVGLHWLLYFARRRPMYGLKPWRGTF